MFMCALYLFLIILTANAQNVDLIRDYFMHKNVAQVVGLSCDEIQNKYEIARSLIDAGISVSIGDISPKVEVEKLLSHYSTIGVYLDLSCDDEGVKEIILESSRLSLYDELHDWLVLAENVSGALGLLNDSMFHIATDLTISIPENNGYDLYQIYNHCKRCGDMMHVEELGSWNPQSGLQITLTEDKFQRRRNYHGLSINAGCIVTSRPKDVPFEVYMTQKGDKPIFDDIGKLGYALTTHVSDMFNITLKIEEMPYWAQNDPVGPLMKGLYQETVQIGILPSIISKERYQFGRPLVQIQPYRSCFMFRTIPAATINMSSIAKPFSMNAWYSIAITSVIIFIILCIVFKIERHGEHPDYMLAFLVVIGALSQQGIPSTSNKRTSRIIYLQILVFGYILFGYYSAAVVSGRLNIPVTKMNDSLYSLAHSNLKLSSNQYVFFDFLMNDSYHEIKNFKKHWLKVPPRKRFLPVEEGIKLIAKGGHAYHAVPSDVYPLIEQNFNMEMICQITEVHLLHPSVLAVFSSFRNTVYEIFRIGLLRTKSAGLNQRQVKLWTSRKPYCNRDKHFISSLTIYEVAPIFILYFCGILCAIIICTIENIIFRLYDK